MTDAGSTFPSQTSWTRRQRDLGLLLDQCSSPGKRRRCPDALEVRRLGRLADATGQQSDVSSLPATVRVQLVEDEEPQIGRLFEISSRSRGRSGVSSSIT